MPRRGPPLTTADAQNPPAHLKYLQRTQSNHGTPLPPHNGGSGMEIPPLMIHGSDREGGSGVHQVGEEMFWESSPNINVNRAAPFERVRVPPPPPAPITPRIRAPAKWPGETVGQCHAVTGGGRGPRCSKPASGGLYCGQHSSMQNVVSIATDPEHAAPAENAQCYGQTTASTRTNRVRCKIRPPGGRGIVYCHYHGDQREDDMRRYPDDFASDDDGPAPEPAQGSVHVTAHARYDGGRARSEMRPRPITPLDRRPPSPVPSSAGSLRSEELEDFISDSISEPAEEDQADLLPNDEELERYSSYSSLLVGLSPPRRPVLELDSTASDVGTERDDFVTEAVDLSLSRESARESSAPPSLPIVSAQITAQSQDVEVAKDAMFPGAFSDIITPQCSKSGLRELNFISWYKIFVFILMMILALFFTADPTTPNGILTIDAAEQSDRMIMELVQKGVQLVMNKIRS